MKDLFRKHWITLLGAVFTFLAFSYLFKFAVDKGWISNELKIGIGIAAGVGFVLAGIALQQKHKNISGQIIDGLGVALLYTTFSFAGIYYAMWTPMTVFLSMAVVTLALSVYSFKFGLRILMNISLLGAIIAPLVMQAQGDQVFTLFLYLLVINTVFFFVSVYKKWTELRLISFLGTWTLFTTYYLYFQPSAWATPFRYAVITYLFYVAAFMASSWKDNLKFDGLNLYLGIINAVAFAIWSYAIMGGVMPYYLILSTMGLIYLGVSFITYGAIGKYSASVVTNFFGGLLFIMISGSEFGTGDASNPMVLVYLWSLVTIFLLAVGQHKKLDVLKLIAAIVWFVSGIYWFTTTWTTPLGIWFNTFVPVFNWSGMAWVVLAAIGFYFSVSVKFGDPAKSHDTLSDRLLSGFFAVAGHLIVGGLLTYQIDNLWEYYDLKFMDLGLTLSISWSIYALILFLWGAYTRQAMFRWFGSAVLCIVAVKTIFINLWSSETIYKILVLFILGIISFTISYINNRWKNQSKTADSIQNDETPKEAVEEKPVSLYNEN